MQAAQVQELSGIDGVEIAEQTVPAPAAGQVLIRVYGAGVGPWDVVFVSGSFPGVATPFVPGQEVAGVIEAVGEQADVQPGDRVYASLFPEGGGFAELALASVERLAPMPEQVSFTDAASVVIAGGTAHEALVDRGRLDAGETVLITAATGGVGSAAVQIARAVGARPLGLASPDNHDYLRDLGASDAFDYHSADWERQLLAAVPGGVDVLLDATGGQTAEQARAAVRDGGRVISVIPPFGALELERGITGESFAAHIDRERLEALRHLIDAGKLRPHVEAVLPLSAAADALRRVAGRHTRGKIALQIAR
jgi:NADPH:quinone reductase